MTSRQQGSMMLITLMLTGLLSLLILSQMQLLILHVKAVNQVKARYSIRVDLELAAAQLIRTNAGGCVRKQDAPNTVIRELQGGGGCQFSFKGYHFRYQIEDLGVIPCLSTLINGQRFSTHHWRLSMARDPSLWLQIRYARAANPEPCLHHAESSIKTGILSWRSLG
ncbi:hypothetical protein [Legionella sp. CNM-4043-24]|uniref:hypothetical protein n=1 Tax=Legionella sp. CNM-4043-24 TaxID=3421646 RepID=UPI00403B1F5F